MDNANRYARYGSITYYGDIDVIIEMFGQPDLIGVVGDEGDVKSNITEEHHDSVIKTIQTLLEDELSRI